MEKVRIAVRKFGPFEKTMQKLWDLFCLENKIEVEVEMVALELEDLYNQTLVQKGMLNGDWDIAHLNTDWIFDAVNGNAVQNLVPYIAQNAPQNYPDGWHQSLLNLQRINDGVYGLPFHDGPECLIYRKDLFEDVTEKQNFKRQHGYELNPPKTWREFVTIAEFFNRPNKNLYGCVFANYPDGHNMVFDFCLQLWTRGGQLVNQKNQIDIHTPEAVAALDFYRKITRNENTTHPGTKYFGSVEAGMAFAKGEAALAINWFGFASMCEVIEESKVKGKVEITQLPFDEGKSTASLNVYWLYTIASGSKNKNLAYQFLRFATTPEADKLLTKEGGIGCRISTWEDAEINETIPYYHKLAALHQNALTLPQITSWDKFAGLIDDMVLQALTTLISSDELLKTTQAQIRKIK
ncbi:extracellular solute-binding protein [Pedobacter alpinus]|uniref:Extracellular solute-binding protein n=1 Tax=Pedobacter alpinus TaxID=1590643 RepID=A0ABW5TQN1_9SPHI